MSNEVALVETFRRARQSPEAGIRRIIGADASAYVLLRFATRMPATDQTRTSMWRTALGVATPTQEEIAARAYLLHLARGAPPGDEFRDWIEAERALLIERHGGS